MRAGVEYIVSRKVFDTLPAEEQRLWHSHAHEITAGLWASPRVPGMLEKPELDQLARPTTGSATARGSPSTWCRTR